MKNMFYLKNLIVFAMLFFLLGSFSLAGQSQKFSLSGIITNPEQEPLSGATVVLLAAKDSVMIGFGISDENGHYSLKRIKEGAYILQVTFIGYENFSEPMVLEVDDLEKEKIKNITLNSAINLLEEVEVTSEHIPIQLKGDTIEYNANAFKTQPNAVVEDLLKQLPGVEVARDGSLKAQGKDVEHVFVDGKEFFGDDPKMASKNLPADAIDKVQVYDKKSDMSEFSGIDDGQREKTINLTLKEDKKNGVFGNITAGYGNDDRYEGKTNLNYFNSKMQLSAIGMANNTNQQAFSIGDYIEFMGGMANLMSGSGSMRLSLDADDAGIPLGNNLNNGIVKTGAGGVNFSYDFSKKTKLNASYFYNSINNSIEEEITRNNFLDNDQSYTSKQESELFNNNASHRLNVNFEQEIDSSQSLKFRSNVSISDGNSLNDKFSQIFNAGNSIENSSLRNYDNNLERIKLNTNLLYRKRFAKLGRIFATDLSFGINNNDRVGALDAINDFYPQEPATFYSDTLMQRQLLNGDQYNYGFKVNYIEPLGKRKYLELNYGLSNNTNKEIKRFYDILTDPERVEVYNSALSRHYVNDYIYNTGGLSFKLNKKNVQWSAGLGLQHSQLNGNLISENAKVNRSYVNLVPRFNLNYDISPSKNFSLQYMTNISAPSIAQLNPVIDNSDPLNIYTGNPNLKPEYSQRLNVNYSSFDQFSFTNFFLAFNAAYTQNKIYDSRNIDSLYRQIIQPINVKNDFLLNSYVNFATPVRFLKCRVNLTLNSMYNKGIDFINGVENNTQRIINTVGISFENRKKEVLDILVGAKLTHNSTTYSEFKNFNQDFLNQTYYGDLTLNFAKSWSISSSIDINVYAAESFAPAQTIPIWKASVSKFILKERGQLKFSALDLLNKNTGINRSSSFNYVQEQRIRSLGRYFLLSFSWKISKFGGSGMHIEMRGR